jgi:hypothetical protein
MRLQNETRTRLLRAITETIHEYFPLSLHSPRHLVFAMERDLESTIDNALAHLEDVMYSNVYQLGRAEGYDDGWNDGRNNSPHEFQVCP